MFQISLPGILAGKLEMVRMQVLGANTGGSLLTGPLLQDQQSVKDLLDWNLLTWDKLKLLSLMTPTQQTKSVKSLFLNWDPRLAGLDQISLRLLFS